MRFSIISIVFRKELREMLRDRRSLAIMFGIPLVLYPALTIIISTLGMSQQKKLHDQVAKVAVVNIEAARIWEVDETRQKRRFDHFFRKIQNPISKSGNIDGVLIVPLMRKKMR